MVRCRNPVESTWTAHVKPRRPSVLSEADHDTQESARTRLNAPNALSPRNTIQNGRTEADDTSAAACQSGLSQAATSDTFGPHESRADPATRTTLERRVRAATTPQRVVRRSRIVLMWLDGHSVEAIATTLNVSRPMVRLWIRRFGAEGPDSLLHDAPRCGRPAVLDPDAMRRRLEAANLLDASGQPISIRRAAAFLGVSAATVWRSLKRSV